MQSCKEFPVHARMRQGSSLHDYSAKHATEKKHEVRIRGWHCVDCHEARDREEARSAPFGRHCAVKYKKIKFPIDFLKTIGYDMPIK